jgi:N-acetylglucosaminyldiphosphoundecaprenol N-acetyl-beta-D-mannosaminyltransferase
VAGYRDGYWDDDDEVAEEVRASGAEYLFLAIPSPRKEFWLNRYLDTMGVAFVMGVGGSFDVVAGKTSRAPRLLQRTGMEWSWRVIQEPRRMWKRYLVGNSKFMKMVAVEWTRERKGRKALERGTTAGTAS